MNFEQNSIDVLKLLILALPKVDLQELKCLPAVSCVYFVVDGNDTIMYIGQSVNLENRFIRHHRWQYFVRLKKPTFIYYLGINDTEKLEELEEFYIKFFSPRMNGLRRCTCVAVLERYEKIRCECPLVKLLAEK